MTDRGQREEFQMIANQVGESEPKLRYITEKRYLELLAIERADQAEELNKLRAMIAYLRSEFTRYTNSGQVLGAFSEGRLDMIRALLIMFDASHPLAEQTGG